MYKKILLIIILAYISISTTCVHQLRVAEIDGGNAKSIGGVEKDSIREADTDPYLSLSLSKLNISGLGNSSIKVSWQNASDLETDINNLKYVVYYSTVDSVSSVGDILLYGTKFDEYYTNIQSKIITGLSPQTKYYFNVIVADDSWNKYAYISTEKTMNYPNTQANNVYFTNLYQPSTIVIDPPPGDNPYQLRVNWTRGNGDSCIVFMKHSSTETFLPIDSIVYEPNTTFGSGDFTYGWTCVYKGTGTSVYLYGFDANETYRAQVFEYNNVNNILYYNITTATNNPNNVTTSTCFIAGTKITMANGSLKNIEDLEIGETVKTVDLESMKIISEKIVEVFHNPPSHELTQIFFDNGITNTNTKAHPYWVIGKGWASADPFAFRDNKDIKINELNIGDKCLTIKDGVFQLSTITKIDDLPEQIINTYNFHVENTRCYFANGVLVHNKP